MTTSSSPTTLRCLLMRALSFLRMFQKHEAELTAPSFASPTRSAAGASVTARSTLHLTSLPVNPGGQWLGLALPRSPRIHP